MKHCLKSFSVWVNFVINEFLCSFSEDVPQHEVRYIVDLICHTRRTRSLANYRNDRNETKLWTWGSFSWSFLKAEGPCSIIVRGENHICLWLLLLPPSFFLMIVLTSPLFLTCVSMKQTQTTILKRFWLQ